MKLFKRLIFRLKNGYSMNELWDLDYTFAKYILPRLLEFKLTTDSYHSFPTQFKDIDEWYEVLDEMIWAFDYIVNHDYSNFDDMVENEKRCNKGLMLFGKYFRNLWD